MIRPSNIRVFDVCRHGSHVLGPGRRYVIWTQGCRRRCPGCLTPESRDLYGGVEIDIDALCDDILSRPFIDGLTISGGEPFLQAEGLTLLLDKVHMGRPEMTVIVYTGYQKEELESIPYSMRLLSYVDVLIDGQYIQSLNDGIGIRGSSNQRIIPISHRLDDYLEIMAKGVRHREVVAIGGQTVSLIGIPDLNNQRSEFCET